MSQSDKDSLLVNKIAAGVLTAGLVLWGANRIADTYVSGEAPEKPAIQLASLPTAAAPVVASNVLESIVPLLAGADVAKGQAFVQQQCSACHSFTKGGAEGVGPNLYGVVGAPMFAHPGFSFSDAAKGKAKGDWNYDNLNEWLASPSHFDPGTAMSYAGIKNTQTRADVVAYLRTLSDNPVPLPSPAEVKAASAPATPPAAAPAKTAPATTPKTP